MSTYTGPASHDEAHAHEIPYATQLRSNRLGLWLFLFSELFLFGALFTSRFVLWGNTRPALSQEIGLLATGILLLSSFFMYRSETAAAYGDQPRFLRSALLAALMGAIFFVMVVVMEWNIFNLSGSLFGIELFGHLKPGDGVFGGIFFAMTGMHALHVLSGIVLILIIWWNGRRGAYTAERHWGVEATAIYWHYVDVVWVFFYPALYLMGHAV
ncbi:MAG: heme-copper oxidase subunit III [Candidatus Promineofilum sp.]|mgnify:FL=1|nr:heme-copper oxidase subunit III [Promineifilum sp.]MBP9657239.1 heme-copper oxidase subunit III [Promineifilum sp.]